MCQCRFILGKKCAILVNDVDKGHVCVGAGRYGKPVDLLNFAVNLKPLGGKKSL